MSKPTTFLIEIDYITRISNSSFCKTFEVILDEKFHTNKVCGYSRIIFNASSEIFFYI